MSTSSRFIFAGVSLLLSLAQPMAARADQIIDTFRNPLDNEFVPCFSISGPYLWAGKTGACSQTAQSLGQPSVPGTSLSEVVGGKRSMTVREPTLTNYVLASLENGELNYATSYLAPSGILVLEYGVGADLNLDVSGDTGFYLNINGQVSNTTPVLLTVTIKSSGNFSSYSWYLTGSARQYLPFANFTGVNWHDVDYLHFKFDSTKVKAIDYTLISAGTFNGLPCGLCTVR